MCSGLSHRAARCPARLMRCPLCADLCRSSGHVLGATGCLSMRRRWGRAPKEKRRATTRESDTSSSPESSSSEHKGVALRPRPRHRGGTGMAVEPPHSKEEVVNMGVTKSHPSAKRKEMTGAVVGPRRPSEEEKKGGRSSGGTASYKSATPLETASTERAAVSRRQGKKKRQPRAVLQEEGGVPPVRNESGPPEERGGGVSPLSGTLLFPPRTPGDACSRPLKRTRGVVGVKGGGNGPRLLLRRHRRRGPGHAREVLDNTGR